jgi:hypothetical protein
MSIHIGVDKLLGNAGAALTAIDIPDQVRDDE